ncbi:hypothetical protein VSO52_19330 [Pseudomonas fulva]|uniref:hypothetical protein n=1 Tax=Pseudomonas fulva TaxID=47880 RepID=UPI002DB5CBD0|nr:hypothetical protein [Pseudomonas fulva]MEC4024916.1 hypothetical protein [Pseudomonas fulva]
MNEDEYERAVETGLRNNEVIKLVHNYCSHARVVNRGGVGLIAQMTGLPIGMLGVDCDYAHASGMAGWDLEPSAVDFYDRNCAHCDKRLAVQMPNLLMLVDERDRAVERHKEARRKAQAQAESAHRARIAQRAALRVGQSAACCSLLDDLDTLDACPSDEVKTRIVETAKLAPEIFTTPLIDYFFELATSNEINVKEQALSVIQQVCGDKARISEAAFDCLAKHDAVEIAADIVMAYPEMVAPAKVERATPALIAHAKRPRSQIDITTTISRPEPLKAIYRSWPEVVRNVIQRLLDQRQSYSVRLGVAALHVLHNENQALLPSFARTLISKLARAHLLLEKDQTDRELEMVCGDLRRIVAIALYAAPERIDEVISEFFDSSSLDGEERLTAVYEELLRLSIHVDEDLDSVIVTSSNAVYSVLLRRLLKLAGTSKNQKVLRLVVQAFSNEPDEIVAAGKHNIDALLGTAAVLDTRIEAFEAEQNATPATNLNDHLEAQNSATTLYQLRKSCAVIAATAAKGSDRLVHSYVEFLNSIDEQRDGLSSTITQATPCLIDSPSTLNIVLPHLYSSLVGASVLRRAAAGQALGELKKTRVSDLPELVLEAFVLLLQDPYVMVHKAAASALSSIDLPDILERRAGEALLNLIFYYSSKKEEHHFLIRCIRLHLDRFSSPQLLQAGLDNRFIKFLMTVPASFYSRDFSRMGKALSSASNFLELVIYTFDDPELNEYCEENAITLVHLIPDAKALERADDLVKLVKRQSGRLILAGAVVELLTRVGAWTQAVAAIQSSWDAIPNTVPKRRFKWYRRLLVVAVQFEAAVAAEDVPTQEALQTEWLQLEALLKEDEKQYESRRSYLPNFLQPDPGS